MSAKATLAKIPRLLAAVLSQDSRAIMARARAGTDNLKAPAPKAGWFSRLSRRRQALLLVLLMFAASAVCFLLGMHDLHAGAPLTSMAGRSDWTDGLLLSAGAF